MFFKDKKFKVEDVLYDANNPIEYEIQNIDGDMESIPMIRQIKSIENSKTHGALRLKWRNSSIETLDSLKHGKTFRVVSVDELRGILLWKNIENGFNKIFIGQDGVSVGIIDGCLIYNGHAFDLCGKHISKEAWCVMRNMSDSMLDELKIRKMYDIVYRRARNSIRSDETYSGASDNEKIRDEEEEVTNEDKEVTSILSDKSDSFTQPDSICGEEKIEEEAVMNFESKESREKRLAAEKAVMQMFSNAPVSEVISNVVNEFNDRINNNKE